MIGRIRRLQIQMLQEREEAPRGKKDREKGESGTGERY